MNILRYFFPKQTEKNTDDSQNPWAGLASYEDPETAERKLKFCGRDDDSYDLARLIMGNVFVTLYGKSGIGKTSLLNAGVFPELREEHYTPVSIRLGMRDDEHPQSYQTMIVDAVERVVKRTETINVIDAQQDQQSIDYLWNYFACHRFYDKNGEPTIPVIVFDQFEEVFRGYRAEAETLLRQLDYINDKDHTLDSCKVDGQPYRYEQNFRFVVSIREDDLYRLEDSIDNCYLPALKRTRYRLRGLTLNGASDAILIPGEGLFSSSEKSTIVERIIAKAKNEDGSISTNLVSLLCNRIFVDFQRGESSYISQSVVDSFLKGNPFERFYKEATRGFSSREKSYIEEHFVDSTGRRNSVPESDFLLHVKNGSKLLEGNSRILQRVGTSSDGGSYRYELIHDSFCEPLIGLKRKREQRKRIMWLSLSAAIVAACLLITSYFVHLVRQNERKDKAIVSTQHSLSVSEAEKDSISLLNSYLYKQIKINEIQKDSLNELLRINGEQKEKLELSLAEQQKLSLSLNEKKQELEDTIIVIRKQSEKIEQMNHKLEKYLDEIKKMNIPIGSTARYMEKGRPESILSNILSDILVWGGKSLNENPDFAVYIIGTIRAPLKEGLTTYWDIIEIAPFDNKICFLTLTGTKVMELFKQIASRKGEGVSHGVKLTISDDGRLLSAYLNGEEIDPNREYRIATLDYVALGFELPALQNGTNVVTPQKPNDVRFLFVNYWLAQSAKGKAVDGQIEGRIIVLK